MGGGGDGGVSHILLRIQNVYRSGLGVMGPLLLLYILCPGVRIINKTNYSLSRTSEKINSLTWTNRCTITRDSLKQEVQIRTINELGDKLGDLRF